MSGPSVFAIDGAALRKGRESRGLSRKKLAGLAGVTESALRRAETTDRASLDTLAAAATALEMGAESLLSPSLGAQPAFVDLIPQFPGPENLIAALDGVDMVERGAEKPTKKRDQSRIDKFMDKIAAWEEGYGREKRGKELARLFGQLEKGGYAIFGVKKRVAATLLRKGKPAKEKKPVILLSLYIFNKGHSLVAAPGGNEESLMLIKPSA